MGPPNALQGLHDIPRCGYTIWPPWGRDVECSPIYTSFLFLFRAHGRGSYFLLPCSFLEPRDSLPARGLKVGGPCVTSGLKCRIANVRPSSILPPATGRRPAVDGGVQDQDCLDCSFSKGRKIPVGLAWVQSKPCSKRELTLCYVKPQIFVFFNHSVP